MSKTQDENNFPQASVNLIQLINQVKVDVSDIKTSSIDTFKELREKLLTSFRDKWPATIMQYKTSITEMPKALRRRDFIKTMLHDLDHFDSEMKTLTSKVAEFSTQNWHETFHIHVNEIEQLVSKLQQETKLVSDKLTEIEENTLIQKFVRGEPVYSCRTKLQWRRKIFHALMGLSFLYIFVYAGLSDLTKNILALTVIFLSLNIEVLRHFNPKIRDTVDKVFGPLMREHEKNQVSAASYYIVSMSVVYFLFPLDTAMLTLLFIAIGDPIAGVIGATFGKIKIKPHVSLEGFMACFVICTVLAFLCSSLLFQHTLSVWLAIIFCIPAGLIGAIAESSFKKIDDNLVMPLLSAPLLWALMSLFGMV